MALNVKSTDPIHKATIIPRGRALGMVMQLPERDKHGHSIKEIEISYDHFRWREELQIILWKRIFLLEQGRTRFRYKPSNKTRKSHGNEIWNE